MTPNSKNIFNNRQLVNKLMYGLAIAMILGMLIFALGPVFFSK